MNANDSLLELNNADRTLLTQLPGVTNNLAYRIVNYSNQHGGFRDWSAVQTTIAFSKAQIQ
jgi:DNA uptake protein ComE-like DNA-binding protein